MTESRHILSALDTSLERLRADLSHMASLAEDNFHHATQAISQRDEDLCNSVIAEDEEVDDLEKKIDADGVNILTRYAPLARDFRRVFTTMKAATDLERVSDQAVGIARRGKRLIQAVELAETRMLEPIFERASGLLRDAVLAFSEGNAELAKGLKVRDWELDKMQHDFVERITRRMEEDPANAQSYLDLVLIARFTERAADHAVNIGDDSVFCYSAQDIRHTRPSVEKAL